METETPQGSWAVVAGGERGTLTADDQGLALSLGSTDRRFTWGRLGLDFPTSYSVRIRDDAEIAATLGFASTAEAQSFRQAVSPPRQPPPEQTTAVLPGVARATAPRLPAGVVPRAFLLGVTLQLLGGLFIAVFWGNGVGVGSGVLLLWAGGIPLLAAIVAWGVKTGIASR